MGRGVFRDASEPRLSRVDAMEDVAICTFCPLADWIGDEARGVVECERISSVSKGDSRGVMGRGIPGMYPGRRGVGETVPGRPYGVGDSCRVSGSMITCPSDDIAVPAS